MKRCILSVLSCAVLSFNVFAGTGGEAGMVATKKQTNQNTDSFAQTNATINPSIRLSLNHNPGTVDYDVYCTTPGTTTRINGTLVYRTDNNGGASGVTFFIQPTSIYVPAGQTKPVTETVSLANGANPMPGKYTATFSVVCNNDEAHRSTFTQDYTVYPEVNGTTTNSNGISTQTPNPQIIWAFPASLQPTNYATNFNVSVWPNLSTSYKYEQASGNASYPSVQWPDASYGQYYTSTAATINAYAYKADVSSSNEIQNRLYVTVNGIRSVPFYMETRTPRRFVAQAPVDYGSNSTYQYESRMYYSIQDQFATTLPSDVPLNENILTVGPYDAPYDGSGADLGNGWDQYAANGHGSIGIDAHPSSWYDHITTPADYASAGFFPYPESPHSPPGSTKVIHYTGNWFVGSKISGKGVLVMNNTYQFYIDHGRHTNIVSPVN